LKRASALFDVEHDGEPVIAKLRASALLRARVDAVAGLRPLGAWSGFELCVRTVIGQQVSVAAARTLMRRLVERCGEVTPECVAGANLQQIGMPGTRVATIQTFAQAVAESRVTLDAPWAQLEAQLKALPGFGPWTRGYLAIRLGRQADAFPETDLGLIRAANVQTAAALLKLAEAWRPYRAYAATYLWAL
jgi:3-methyladenine DNA glycosylase/8-oxoguanine DNA glycosylase